MLFAYPLTACAVDNYKTDSITNAGLNSSQNHQQDLHNSSISIAAFSTIDVNKKLAINPFISGNIGSFYFENRYNYEANNSASINIGKKLANKLLGFEITPMVGLVAGGFKGITSEVQAGRENKKWSFSIDNQYTLEYAEVKRSFYSNWLSGKFKLAGFLQAGISTLFVKCGDKRSTFDKGLAVSFLYDKFSFNMYAFNYEPKRRNYMFSLRYNLKLN